MEELFLSRFLSYYKLYVVNQKNIDIAVTMAEGIDQSDIIRIPQRIDQLIGECFGRNIPDGLLRLCCDDVAGDRMHQVRLAKSRASVDKQRVVHPAGRFCYGNCRRMRKLIIGSDDEVLKGILWVQSCIQQTYIQFRIHARNLNPGFSAAAQLVFLGLLRKNKTDLIFSSGDLCNGDL